MFILIQNSYSKYSNFIDIQIAFGYTLIMNFQDIRYVNAICTEGSFLKASAYLGITQPTLSKRIDRIEYKLGATLFIRSKGKSSPTPLALFIADRAIIILKQMSFIENEIKSHADGSGGNIRLGVGPVPFRNRLVSLIKSLREKYPDIALEIVTGSVDQIADQLVRGELDVIICQAGIEIPSKLIKVEKLIESEIILVAKIGHPLTKIKNLSLNKAFEFPAALPFINKEYESFIQKNYNIVMDEITNKITCSDYSLLLRLVQEESFFSLGPILAFEKELTSGEIVKLDLQFPIKHKINVLTNSNMYMTPARKNFLSIVETEFY